MDVVKGVAARIALSCLRSLCCPLEPFIALSHRLVLNIKDDPRAKSLFSLLEYEVVIGWILDL